MKLPEKITDWPSEWREVYEERSAIIQFEAGLLQSYAELEAEKDVRKIARDEVCPT